MLSATAHDAAGGVAKASRLKGDFGIKLVGEQFWGGRGVMLLLILGLVIFLGVHSIRIFANDWRRRQILHLGEGRWKGLFALASLVGLVLIIVGFGAARSNPAVLYAPPAWLRHLNSFLTLIAFVLVAAAYAPRNHIKARIGHPMLAGVKTWAFGHLLAIGMLRDVVLFGAFLLWAIADFVVSRRRDRAAGVIYPAGSLTGDVVAIVVGVIVWMAFAFWLHTLLIGVNPLA
jgi:uncharacterized membrane protein